MNKGAKDFINNMGLLCETWTIVYRKFRSQGLKKREALVHTQAMMATVLADIRKNSNGGT